MTQPVVSRETQIRLDAFASEFSKWSRTTNLTSAAERDNLPDRHIADSLQLASIIEPAGRWVDIGTGGGFPGAVLAALFAERNASITMIESNQKKAAFLRAAVAAMGVRANVLAERAERVVARSEAPNVVTARAVASLDRLIELTSPWLEAGTIGMFPKGRNAGDEIEKARQVWDFDLVTHPSVVAEDSVVLQVSNVRPKASMLASENRRDKDVSV